MADRVLKIEDSAFYRQALIISEVLRRHYKDARPPDPGDLLMVAVAIGNEVRWTPGRTPQALGFARFKHGAALRPEEWRRIWPPSQELIDHSPRQWRDWLCCAAETFSEAQGWEKSPEKKFTPSALAVRSRPRLAKRAALPEPWKLALAGFASWLAAILAQRGLRISTRETSPFTKTCSDLLLFIVPADKMPTFSKLSRELGKIIDIS